MWYLFDMFWYLLRGLFIVNNTYSKFEFNLPAKSANKDHHLSVPRVLIGAVCQARSESEWIVKASKIFCLPNSLSSSAKLGETCWNSAYSANLAVVSIPFRGGGFKHLLFFPYLGKWSKIYPNWLILFKRVSEKPPPIFSFGASSLKDSDHKSETIWVSLCQKKKLTGWNFGKMSYRNPTSSEIINVRRLSRIFPMFLKSWILRKDDGYYNWKVIARRSNGQYESLEIRIYRYLPAEFLEVVNFLLRKRIRAL